MMLGYPRHRWSVPKHTTHLTGLLATTMLRHMGLGAAAVFMPLYLFRIGGLDMVVGYMVAVRILEVLLATTVARIIGRIGLKWGMVIGQLILVIVLAIFPLVSQNPDWIYVIIPLVPFAALFYWTPHSLMFLHASGPQLGTSTGMLQVAANWSGVVGPVIGGLWVTVSGFGGLFWWGVVMVAASIIPIFTTHFEDKGQKFHLDKYWGRFTGAWFRKDMLAYFGRGMEEEVYEVFWPLFLIVILGGQALSLGSYKTGVLLLSSLFVMMVGRKLDRGEARKYLHVATGLLIIMWVIRAFLRDQLGLLILDTVDGFVGAIGLFLPFTVYGWMRAKKADTPLYIVERETALNMGRVTGAAAVWLIAFAGGGWSWMTIVGITGLVMMNFLPEPDIQPVETEGV